VRTPPQAAPSRP
jgi:chromosome segregation ATPase